MPSGTGFPSCISFADASAAQLLGSGAPLADALEEIARDRLLWGSPDDVIAQIKRYQAETGCDHLHAAFGSGLPADTSEHSTFGSFEDLAGMFRLFGREVIPAFAD